MFNAWVVAQPRVSKVSFICSPSHISICYPPIRAAVCDLASVIATSLKHVTRRWSSYTLGISLDLTQSLKPTGYVLRAPCTCVVGFQSYPDMSVLRLYVLCDFLHLSIILLGFWPKHHCKKYWIRASCKTAERVLVSFVVRKNDCVLSVAWCECQN